MSAAQPCLLGHWHGFKVYYLGFRVHPSSLNPELRRACWSPWYRFKMYVGETNNMARRHGGEYQLNGDHLIFFLEAALADGCTIWRRVRYTVRRIRVEGCPVRRLIP